jgi:hypothetical protein
MRFRALLEITKYPLLASCNCSESRMGFCPCAGIVRFQECFSVVERVRPIEFYNLACPLHWPLKAFESISLSTLNVLECMRILKLEIKLYNADSHEAFGNTPDGTVEDTLFQPRSQPKRQPIIRWKNHREARRCTSARIRSWKPKIQISEIISRMVDLEIAFDFAGGCKIYRRRQKVIPEGPRELA